MLNEQLRESTQPSHQALEKKMVSVIRKIRTRQDYVKFLKLMYGYYSALEKRVQEYVSELEIGKRRKAERLLQDISYFESTGMPALCNELPPICSHAEALGAMYVMEGSTQGGKIIAQMIEGQAGINGPSGFSFFNGYGEENSKMWEEFKAFLNRPLDEMEKLNLILTANRTFITFYNWIDKHAAL
ncbi:MAG TPA: biliverdin-producing heme oxygenase [Cyclobacteriaceae bacterium]|nr:biliverdin-producing heme oxygenase [Cyclobacteriaceae bacterium]